MLASCCVKYILDIADAIIINMSNINKFISPLLSATVLSGCNSDSPSANPPATPAVSMNGVYVSQTENVAILVDTQSDFGVLMTEPFEPNDFIYALDFEIKSDTHIAIERVFEQVENVIDVIDIDADIYFDDKTATVHFENKEVGKLNRLDGTVSYNSLIGNFTSKDQHDWIIYPDKRVTINTSYGCILEAKFHETSYYWTLTSARVSNCPSEYSSFNRDDYIGVLFAYEYNSKIHVNVTALTEIGDVSINGGVAL